MRSTGFDLPAINDFEATLVVVGSLVVGIISAIAIYSAWALNKSVHSGVAYLLPVSF